MALNKKLPANLLNETIYQLIYNLSSILINC